MSSGVTETSVPKHKTVVAVSHVRRMRGGAQGHMMRCSDGNFYIVKFCNNPQHPRVLANEMFATRLAEEVGLPVPSTAIVEVAEQLVAHTPDLCIQFAHHTVPCQAGIQFGSRYVVDPVLGQVLDCFPVTMLCRVRNLETFAGMLVLDKWLGNADGRQAAFWRRGRERSYQASFIDHGYCFSAGDWTFPDDPLRGVYASKEVYEGVRGWDSFQPWLSRIENLREDLLWKAAEGIPSAWYGGDSRALENLACVLIARRRVVRDLIDAFRFSSRHPFPMWN